MPGLLPPAPPVRCWPVSVAAPHLPRPKPGRPVPLPLTESGGTVLGQDGRHLAAGSAARLSGLGRGIRRHEKLVASASLSTDRQTPLAPGKNRHGARPPHALVTAPWHARAHVLLVFWLRGSHEVRFYSGGLSGGRREGAGPYQESERTRTVTIVLPRRHRKGKMRNSHNKTFASCFHAHFAEIVQEECTRDFISSKGDGMRQE